MIPVRNPRLRGAILATAFASSMAVGPMAHAAGEENFTNVDLKFQGGDAKVLALCVNFAKTWTTYDEKKKKKLEKVRIAQANECNEKVKAVGGDVVMDYVDVVIVSKEGKKTPAPQAAARRHARGLRAAGGSYRTGPLGHRAQPLRHTSPWASGGRSAAGPSDTVTRDA